MNKISQNRTKDHSGFSLIELLVICSVSFILLAASVPSIQKSLLAYRLESAASLLSAQLTEAKLTAIKHNRPAFLKINTVDRQGEIWTTDPNGYLIRVSIVTLMAGGIDVDATSPLQVDFTSLGRNPAGSSVIKFSISGTSYCKGVTVNQVGNITVNPTCP